MEIEKQTLRFGTLAVHAGERAPLPAEVPTSTPIYASTTFLSESASALDEVLGGTRHGYVYARYSNPTVRALEDAVNALEGGAATAALGSGMAALHVALLLTGLGPGDVLLAARDLYGSTHSLLNNVLASSGVVTRYADLSDERAFRAALSEQPTPRAVLVEPISNPLIKLVDLEALTRATHRAGALLIVDNTFASPFLLRPLEYGADVVVHSATKYLGGHGDATGGTVTVRDAVNEAGLRSIARLTGAVLSPFEAHLILRGIKTLALRMREHCHNAQAVAGWLEQHPAVARVHYPGLPGHASNDLARRLFPPGYFGGMLAFELREAGRERIFKLINSLRLLVPATTLGDVCSEVSYPVMSSHRDWSPELRRQAGIVDGLLQLSVGIEEVEDILDDLKQALEGR